MTNYDSIELDVQSSRVFFWEKLVIDNNFNTHNLKRDVESKIPNSKVFINELILNQSKIENILL